MQSTPLEDAELILSMLKDEPGAWQLFGERFDRLVRHWIANVTRRFSSMVSLDDQAEIRAIFYESLVANDKRKLRMFDPERGNRLSTWIALLVGNCARDYLRRLRREPEKAPIADHAEDERLTSWFPDPYEQAMWRERAEIAELGLADCSEKDRHLAELYFGEGMEPAEIASVMRISVKTVHTKKHKIQSRLAEAANRSSARLRAATRAA